MSVIHIGSSERMGGGIELKDSELNWSFFHDLFSVGSGHYLAGMDK